MTSVTGVVLVTCSELPGGDEDAEVLGRALARRGIEAQWAAWTDRDTPWAYVFAVIRSTWDYTAHREDFLAWAGHVPRLANPAEIVAWNSDKAYLRDLDAAGVPIVPTDWIEPGQSVALPLLGEYVVKPSIGAGSRGAGRFSADDADAARAHAAALHDAGRVVLVQPYQAGVETSGETALIYFNGAFSHAVSKGAMLPEGAVNPLYLAHDELYIEEQIQPRAAAYEELAVGDQVLGLVRDRFGSVPLYARVDLVPSPVGPLVIELELVEPSLFLNYADGAADRFADAIAAHVGVP